MAALRSRHPRVEVEWLDATSDFKQMTLAEAAKKCQLDTRFTLGFLLSEDDDKLVVMQTYDPVEHEGDEESGADFTTIPRGWVKNIIYLRVGRAPEREGDSE